MSSSHRSPSKNGTEGEQPERAGHSILGQALEARFGGPSFTLGQSGTASLTVSYYDSEPYARPIALQKPALVMSYSLDASDTQRFDDCSMRYYVDPPKGARLDYGYERWIRKPDERGRLDGLLKALLEMKRTGFSLPNSGIVGWRGEMTKILTAPYQGHESWELNIMHVNGALYLEEHLTDEQLQKKLNMDPWLQQQMYYGYAFESYCTANSPKGRPPGWGDDVNTYERWFSVVTTKLGDIPVLIGGEVDCVRPQHTGWDTDTFVELKTSKVIKSPQDEERFEKKLLKFYFQSFLLGVPDIIVGFRTHRGILSTVQTFKTLEIPSLVHGKPGAWDPPTCLEFGERFFRVVKEAAASVDDASVWRATFTPGEGVSVRLLDQAGVEEVVNEEDRVGLLPRWYWDELVAA